MPNPWEMGFQAAAPAPAAKPWEMGFQAAAAAPKSGVMDFLSSLPRGLLGGLSDAASAGGQAAALEMGQDHTDIPDSKTVTEALEKNVTGDLPQPEGLWGHVGASVGGVLGNPASYVGGGSLPAKVIAGIGTGAGSELAAQAVKGKGSGYELAARLLGGLAGGSAPHIAGRVVTPIPAEAAHTAAVTTLRNEGVDSLSAGQVTNNSVLKNIEDILSNTPFGGNGAARLNSAQGEEFTRAALRRVGENAPRATPEVVDGAFRRIGGDFDNLSARNRMEGDAQLGNELHTAITHYSELVPESQRAPLVDTFARELGDAVVGNGGSLPGEAYQSARSRLSAAARGTNDNHLSHVLSDMTEAMDDAMARSIARNNPGDTGGFEQARREYRNMLVVERAASAAGENPAKGLITPAQLASSAKAVMGRRAWARGQGDFEPLARAGQAALLPLPNSGTAQKMNALHHLQLGGLFAGEAAAGGAHSWEGAAAAAALGLAGPAVAGRTLMSPPVQRYLGNQLMPNVPGLFQTAPLQPAVAAGQ